MADFITGISNYPADFDINPTGTGTAATLNYVLDEVRDPGTGIITQSGNTVVAPNINDAYTVIDKVQRILGIHPEDTFDNVAARLNFLAFSGSLAFMPLTGGSMQGALVMPSGVNLLVQDITSTDLNWVISTGATITASGDYSLNADGLIDIRGGNVDISGTLLKGLGTNINLEGLNSTLVSGGSTVSLISDQNQIILNTGNTSISHDFTPVVSGSIDIGSTGAYFSTLYVNNLVSISGESDTFVSKSGSNIFGDMVFTGTAGLVLGNNSSILNTTSGTNDIGDVANPMGRVFTKTLFATNISGLSPITFLSDVKLAPGVNLSISGSGASMGSASNPLDTIYVNNVIGATGLDMTQLVTKTGSSISGDLSFTGNASMVMTTGSNIIMSGSNIVNQQSGLGDIGSDSSRFENIYADKINGASAVNLAFNESLSGTIDGANRIFTLQNSPTNGYVNIFVSGNITRSSIDWEIAGAIVTFTGTFPAPNTEIERPYASFYVF